MTTSWTFWVAGKAEPQGSLKSHTTKGGGVVTRHDNPRLRPWRQAVAWEARAAGVRMLTGPVALHLLVYLPRPKGHYGRHGLLPRYAEARPCVAPDADKLARGAGDALQGIGYLNDSQIVALSLQKFYAGEEGPGVRITLCALSAGGDE